MTEDFEVTVAPVEGGWCVQSAGMAELMFLSGARAEEGGKALAATLARCGKDVSLVVQDRRFQVVGARRYFADV
jgi:hypothetical protein